MRTMLVWGIGLGLVLAAGPPRAATAQGDTGHPDRGPAPTLRGKLRLALSDAVAMGIENNLAVAVERYEPLIAREDLGIAWGSYDPEATAEYGIADNETPVATALQAGGLAEDRIYDGRTGIQGLVPLIGASYELVYTGSETRTNRSIVDLSPEFDAALLATLRIPLLRNLFWSEPWTNVKRARVGVTSAGQEFRRQLMDVVREIEDAYWGLVAAGEQRQVAEKSLETARALLAQTEAQYEVGVVSRVEVTEAEAGVADRDFQLIRNDNLYRTAQDRLVDLVLGPNLTAVSTLEIDPTDPPESVSVRDVDLEVAMAKAVANRPELALVRDEIERQQIELAFARNQRLPRLDVLGSYGYQGLAGRTNPEPPIFGGARPPPTVGSRYSSTDDDFFSGDGARQWSARGVFSIPLGNVRGRHDVRKRELELQRSETRLRQVQQRIVLEIREAARNLRSGLEGIEAAERNETAAAEQLRAERVRLEYGEATPFEVLQREEDLADARSQKIGAQQVYHGAVTGLDRAQGTILSSRNIRVDDAAALR